MRAAPRRPSPNLHRRSRTQRRNPLPYARGACGRRRISATLRFSDSDAVWTAFFFCAAARSSPLPGSPRTLKNGRQPAILPSAPEDRPRDHPQQRGDAADLRQAQAKLGTPRCSRDLHGEARSQAASVIECWAQNLCAQSPHRVTAFRLGLPLIPATPAPGRRQLFLPASLAHMEASDCASIHQITAGRLGSG